MNGATLTVAQAEAAGLEALRDWAQALAEHEDVRRMYAGSSRVAIERRADAADWVLATRVTAREAAEALAIADAAESARAADMERAARAEGGTA